MYDLRKIDAAIAEHVMELTVEKLEGFPDYISYGEGVESSIVAPYSMFYDDAFSVIEKLSNEGWYVKITKAPKGLYQVTLQKYKAPESVDIHEFQFIDDNLPLAVCMVALRTKGFFINQFLLPVEE